MPGNPAKRGRKLAEALRAQGIDPDAMLTAAPGTHKQTATAPNVRTIGMEALNAPQRPHPPAPAPARVIPAGPQLRHEVDTRAASDLSALADQLQPGLTCRIERTRPTWAAGWVEDLQIDDHDLGAVLEYISAEHGGQMYRATVIGIEGQQLYTARIPISGPPRRRGRLLPRSAWDGTDDETPRHIPQQTNHAPAFDLKDLGALFATLQNHGADRGESVIAAVREMTTQSARTTADLLRAVMQQRADEKKGGGFREHLQEFVNASHAIEEVREVLGVHNAAPAKDDETGGLMRGVLTQAAAQMIKDGMANDAQRTQAPAQPPPGFRRVQPRRAPPTPPTNGAGPVKP